MAIDQEQGNAQGAAQAYHQLGIIALKQKDYSAAEAWYRKSLAITEEQGNVHGVAITYAQLGNLALIQEDYSLSSELFSRAANNFMQVNDLHYFHLTVSKFAILLSKVKQNTPEQEQQFIAHWDKTVPFPWAQIDEQLANNQEQDKE